MAKRLKIKSDEPIKAPHPKRYSVLNEELDHLAIPEIYPELIRKLGIDLKRAGEGVLRDLIHQTPEDMRLAGYIYAIASEDYDRVKDEYEALMGKWCTRAREEIAKLKKDKRWEGGVYTADVERWVAGNIPDHKMAKEVVRKSRRLRDSARRLFEVYQSRLSSLQSYGRLIQKRKGLSVEQRHSTS
jgi:hypothetical protein